MANVSNIFIDKYMLCGSIYSIIVSLLLSYSNWPRLRAGAFLVQNPLARLIWRPKFTGGPTMGQTSLL